MKKDTKRAQVILETVMIFAAVALLACGAAKVFSNLNGDMLKRLDVYSRSRPNSLNSLFSGFRKGLDPRDYLSLGVPKGILDLSLINPALASGDRRILEAMIRLQKANSSLNFLLSFKVSQMAYIYRSMDKNFRPRKYALEIAALSEEAIASSKAVLADMKGAKELINRILQTPMRHDSMYGGSGEYGPYDEVPADMDNPPYHPAYNQNGRPYADIRLPNYEGTSDCKPCWDKYVTHYAKTVQILRRSVENNRVNLRGALKTLERNEQDIQKAIYGNPALGKNSGLIPRLTFVRDNMVNPPNCDLSLIVCALTRKIILQYFNNNPEKDDGTSILLALGGEVVPSIFDNSFLSGNGSVRGLNTIHSWFQNSWLTIPAYIAGAKDTAAAWKKTINAGRNISIRGQGDINQKDIDEINNSQLFKEYKDLNPQEGSLTTVDLKQSPIEAASDLFDEIIDNLDEALKMIENAEGARLDGYNLEEFLYYISSAKINVDILYEIAAINRREPGNHP